MSFGKGYSGVPATDFLKKDTQPKIQFLKGDKIVVTYDEYNHGGEVIEDREDEIVAEVNEYHINPRKCGHCGSEDNLEEGFNTYTCGNCNKATPTGVQQKVVKRFPKNDPQLQNLTDENRKWLTKAKEINKRLQVVMGEAAAIGIIDSKMFEQITIHLSTNIANRS